MSEVVTENDDWVLDWDNIGKIVRCDNCGEQLAPAPDPNDLMGDHCPNCNAKDAVVVGEHLTERSMRVWDDANNVGEMVESLEEKLAHLQKLDEQGWCLDEDPREGHALLRNEQEREESFQFSDHKLEMVNHE